MGLSSGNSVKQIVLPIAAFIRAQTRRRHIGSGFFQAVLRCRALPATPATCSGQGCSRRLLCPSSQREKTPPIHSQARWRRPRVAVWGWRRPLALQADFDFECVRPAVRSEGDLPATRKPGRPTAVSKMLAPQEDRMCLPADDWWETRICCFLSPQINVAPVFYCLQLMYLYDGAFH